MIDFFAREWHYHDHLAPIWQTLDPSERGTFWVRGRTVAHLADRPGYTEGRPSGPGVPVCVASFGDYEAARGRPVVYLEHGVGQQYPGGSPGYAGSSPRDRVVLFLNPNDHTSEANAYHGVPSVTVGVPWLDRIARRERTGRTVVFSWHWDNRMAGASRSAFDHYKQGLPRVWAELRSRGWDVLGHAHPRAWSKPPSVRGFYDAHDVAMCSSFEDAVDRADVWCCDNSSAQFLTAAVGVRQVALEAPWYTEAAEQGLWPRWAHTLGAHVLAAEQIPDAVEAARCPDVSDVVPHHGQATRRAVEALRAHVL